MLFDDVEMSTEFDSTAHIRCKKSTVQQDVAAINVEKFIVKWSTVESDSVTQLGVDD